MSTPPPQTTPPKEPFGLLRALFTGLALGAAAVVAGPYLFPAKDGGQTFAQPARHGKPERPQAAVERPKPEPVLVPAAGMQFPKPAAALDMTGALEPLLSFKISEEDIKAVKEAAEAAKREDGEDARAAIKKISAPPAKIFADWMRLHVPRADFEEVMAFRAAHPFFPEPPQDALIEKHLFLSDTASPSVLRFYSNRVPLTGAGYASLGAAFIETGEQERGLALIKYAWGRYALDPAVAEKFRSRFGALLNEDDHRRRARLLAAHEAYKNDPGKLLAASKGKKGLKAAARLKAKNTKNATVRRGSRRAEPRRRRRGAHLETGPLVRGGILNAKAAAISPPALYVPVELKKPENKESKENAGKDGEGNKAAGGKAKEQGASAPAAKTLQAEAAEDALALTKERQAGPATLLVRLKALRRKDSDNELWSILRSISPDRADLADPERWWDFRRSEVRFALNDGHPKTAYAIAKAHGPLAGENLSEAEFLAGWIALRFLKDPHRAISHFEASRVLGFGRYEARAAYWLGRAKAEIKAGQDAQAHFADAAGRYFTFYGGLARWAVRKSNGCEFRAPPQPSQETVTAFVNEDAFKAVMIAKQAGLDSLLVSFALDLARQIRDPEQMTLLMELIGRTTPAHAAVRAAKIALLRGYATEAYAYPVLMPKFSQSAGAAKLEPALLNALTRQESEFNTETVSHAGARGLMQLMPQTAKNMASALKMKYELSRLVSDPSYNVTLGSAFLAKLLAGYDGSYVLTLAAYNAGPGRVAEWIKDFGDPRAVSIDAIDWIERIPFTETRQYVQRIIESVQLYRCRLEDNKTAFQIAEDLHRGRPGKLPDITDVSGSANLDEAP
jgi:soluble lytic murein transglycosylase